MSKAGCSMVGVVEWNSGRPQAGTYSHSWRRVISESTVALVTVVRDGDKVAG